MSDHLRPTTAFVDLDGLQRNYDAIRKAIPGSTKMLASVKGDAYGHGAVACARRLEAAGVDWFGVALVEEGRTLRHAGIQGPILCLGGAGPLGSRAAIENNLTPLISDIESAREMDWAAQEMGEQVEVHIKVDTGMGRLGVPFHLWSNFLDRIAELQHLQVTGIASHLAQSESNAGGVETDEQIRKFEEATSIAKMRGFAPELIHLSNSGAILQHPTATYGMVRPGLLLYGYDPAQPQPRMDVQPIMRVQTKVLVVRDLPVGVGVSYGGQFRTTRPSRIATLPVGYADGYSRALSNKAEVLIHGHRAPILGRICMDMCMIDVTDVPHHVRAGDVVVLMGQQGSEDISAWDLARAADTIPYEVLTGFSERIPRVS